MTIDLTKCIVTHLKFGEMTETVSNEELIVFSHPNYFERADPILGHLYAEYEKAFICFDINNS